MTADEFETTLNELGQTKVPFLFFIDFEESRPFVAKLSEIDADEIVFDINGISNTQRNEIKRDTILLKKLPISFDAYKKKFDVVADHIVRGDCYLCNLTIKTELILNMSLREVFDQSNAKYKLWYKDHFLTFSPETFIKIESGKIFTYPMKGTIDARIPNAEEKILSDQKEMAEHVTIVDLLRNDISTIAENVQVTRFRFVETILTNEKPLLQVSSEICGDLKNPDRLGTILRALLPAGSVSGAPKKKTLEIISEAEGENRGYYTGIVGLFDGRKLDSGVMIRYIEQIDGRFFYRSGGGITAQSNCVSEYNEAIDKVYVPVN
jgi:para-aminobenzoate synthetase component I